MYGHLDISVDIISADRYEKHQHFKMIFFPNITSFEMCQKSLMLFARKQHIYAQLSAFVMSERENRGKGSLSQNTSLTKWKTGKEFGSLSHFKAEMTIWEESPPVPLGGGVEWSVRSLLLSRCSKLLGGFLECWHVPNWGERSPWQHSGSEQQCRGLEQCAVRLLFCFLLFYRRFPVDLSDQVIENLINVDLWFSWGL